MFAVGLCTIPFAFFYYYYLKVNTAVKIPGVHEDTKWALYIFSWALWQYPATCYTDNIYKLYIRLYAFPSFYWKEVDYQQKQTGSEISDFLAGFLNTESVSKLITVIAINKRINS